ncbi:glycosyltransferase family 1 protein, partial [Candidatus Bathyarchaeota archaeon]
METLRILWLNWRCIKHPLAGGAEVYTHEIAKRLAKLGHEIFLFTSRPRNLPEKEFIDGYIVLRGGNNYSVYLQAAKTYKEKFKGKIDAVIDEINTIPFMTPLYVKEPIITLIHQLCRECWFYSVPLPVAVTGYVTEPALHLPYIKNSNVKAVVTVSASTKQDLINIGYPEYKIHIVPNGLNVDQYGPGEKTPYPQICYVGRITPYKKLETLIKTMKILQKEISGIVFIIAGRAELKYLRKLRRLAEKYDVNVRFKINISHAEKIKILRESWILVYSSVREGFGQTIVEANACGTPAVAYNILGIRDSIEHMKTGILVSPRNI